MQKCLKLSKNKYILKLFKLAIMLLIVESFDIKKVKLTFRGSILISLFKVKKIVLTNDRKKAFLQQLKRIRFITIYFSTGTFPFKP